jgi:hypothetical protein
MTMDAEGVPRRVELPTGELIWVRVEVPEPVPDEGSPGGTAPDVGGRRVRKNHPSVDDDGQISQLIGFTETVGGIAHSVRKSLAAARPDRVEVEFGLEIDGSTGKVISLVASAHAKASIKVRLGWDQGSLSDAPAVTDISDGIEAGDGIDAIEGIDAAEDPAEDPTEDDALDRSPREPEPAAGAEPAAADDGARLEP